MKTYIILILLIFSCYNMQAQDDDFFNNKWKARTLYSVFKKGTLLIYHKDSAVNKTDYSKYELKFFKTGKYEGRNQGAVIESGNWQINAAKDSIKIGTSKRKLMQLDVNNLITRGYYMQLVDTLGNLDTVYTYTHLYSVKDNSSGDGSANIKGSENQLYIYPNPSHSLSVAVDFVTNSQDANALLVLSTLIGEKIIVKPLSLQRGKNNITLQLPDNLSNGVYIVELQSKANNKKQKLILLR